VESGENSVRQLRIAVRANLRPVLGGLLALLATACTTVGMHTAERSRVDYGPPATLRVCLLVNEGLPPERGAELIAAVNTEFKPYGITVVVPWSRPWHRPGFDMEAIIEELITHELEPPCDRLLGLVGRNAGDFIWGLFLPEALGAVDANTHTHGYVVASVGSVNQVFAAPSDGMVHEFYHMLGCPHELSLTACYHLIAEIKSKIPEGRDLFPGRNAKGRYIFDRATVNAILKAEQALRAENKRHPSGAEPGN
jgi:hypothetical protein